MGGPAPPGSSGLLRCACSDQTTRAGPLKQAHSHSEEAGSSEHDLSAMMTSQFDIELQCPVNHIGSLQDE